MSATQRQGQPSVRTLAPIGKRAPPRLCDRTSLPDLECRFLPFQAQLTIESPVGRVTGTKLLDPTVDPLLFPSYGFCETTTSLGFPVGSNAFLAAATYSAVITTATSTCTTHGTGTVSVVEQDAPGHPNVDSDYFGQLFRTGSPPICTPRVDRPTNKAQCKKSGWRRFTNPSFKNQGQCVKFVNQQRAKAGKRKGDDEKGNGKKMKGKKK